jgi:hypothetical protein
MFYALFVSLAVMLAIMLVMFSQFKTRTKEAAAVG